MTTPRARLLTIALTLLGVAGLPTAAQTGTSSPPPRRLANPSPIELSDELFQLSSVGLSMRLPVGATAEATKIGGKMTAQILPADRSWLINVQTPQTSNPEATIKQAADDTVALLQGAFGKLDPNQVKVMETEAKLLERVDNLILPGGPAERLYISVPAGDGRIVKGYTIFKPAPKQFVVFELIVAEPDFAAARGAYETIIATATFVDPVVQAASRGQAVKAGVALFSRLTTADLDAIADGTERWFRIAVPAPSGNPADAEEVGYRGVTFWKGKRGEVDPDRPMIRWRPVDREEGYLCRVRARVRQGADLLDSEGIYFMSPDRQEEAWSVQMAIRDAAGKVKGVWRETGVRAGAEMQVSVEETGKPGRDIRPLFESDGYITQVEAFMLPQLLIRGGVETEYGFYTYRSDSGTVALRRDTLARDVSVAGTEAWTITTRFREDVPPQVSRYTAAGELIRTDRGNDQVVTPIELKQLAELWARKGLPVGPTEPRRRR